MSKTIEQRLERIESLLEAATTPRFTVSGSYSHGHYSPYSVSGAHVGSALPRKRSGDSDDLLILGAAALLLGNANSGDSGSSSDISSTDGWGGGGLGFGGDSE